MIKILQYFLQSLIVYFFFIIGRFLGLRKSQKFFSKIFRILGPKFKSKITIDKNLSIFNPEFSTMEKNDISSHMWSSYGKTFIEYVMNEEYVTWLGMAPEGSFPIIPGPNAGSKIFIEEWGNLPIGVDRKVPINQIYSHEIIESLINGLSVGTRWGASEGQLPVAAKLVNSGLMNRLMMEYINGDRTAEATVDMLNSEASKL